MIRSIKNTISLKIWLSFSLALAVIIAIFLFYYPKKQEELILKFKKKEISELSRTIALSVELSLDEWDFSKLSKSLEYYENRKKEFDFLALINLDSINSNENRVFASISEDKNINYFNIDSTIYTFQSTPFETIAMKGIVVVGLKNEKIKAEIKLLNNSIYYSLFTLYITSFIISLILGVYIANPINKVIKNAKYLEIEDYENFNLLSKKGNDEISNLTNALISLKKSIIEQKRINKELTNSLEEKIIERTADLEKTLTNLNTAQKVAKISNFNYLIKENKWECSRLMYEILGINENPNTGLDIIQENIHIDFKDEFIEFKNNFLTKSFKNREFKYLKENKFIWISFSTEIYFENNIPSIIVGTIQDITDKKIIEEEIEKLSLVAKNTSNCVIITDANRKIVWVNDSVIKLTGYSYNEIIGNTPKMFQFEKTDPKTISKIAQALKKNETVRAEILNKGKHGNEYWLELYIQPVFNKFNNLVSYIAVEIDITDRKIAEKTLLESEQRFKLLSEVAFEGIIISENGIIKDCNNRFLEMLNFKSKEEAIDTNVFDFIHPDDLNSVNEIIKIQNPKPHEVKCITKSGKIIWVESTGLFAPINGKNMRVSVLFDITKRKESEELIKNYIKTIENSQLEITKINEELEIKVIEKTKDIQRLASIPTQFDNPIFEYNITNNEVLYANPAANHYFNENKISAIEIIKKIKVINSKLDSSVKNIIELKGRYFEITLFNILDSDNYRIFLYDISDRIKNEKLLNSLIDKLKETENDLINKKNELEDSLLNLQLSQQEIIKKEKLSTLGMLIAGIAHEVNTPLGAIKASAENLEFLFNNEFIAKIAQLSLSEIADAVNLFYISITKNNIITLTQNRKVKDKLYQSIIENIPDCNNPIKYSKQLSELHFIELNQDLIDFLKKENANDVLDFTITLNKIYRTIETIKSGSEKGSKLIKALNSYSHGNDENKLSSLNLNESIENCVTLLWNKIKYGATIENNVPNSLIINGYQDELSQVWTNLINNALQASNNKCKIVIDYKQDNNYHIVSFENNGPKIPDEIIHKIFDPFFTTKIKGEGTGLGLNIVNKIIEKHGGYITVSSNEEKTIFSIFIPTNI